MRMSLPDSCFVLANAEKATVKEIDQHLAKLVTSDEAPDFFVEFVRGSCLPRREMRPRIRDRNGVQLRDPKTNKPRRTVNKDYHAQIAQDNDTARDLIRSWKVKADVERKRLAPIKARKLASAARPL